MAAKILQYQLEAQTEIGEIATALQSRFGCESEPEQSLRTILYDSFDWRLYRADLQLVEEKGAAKHDLMLSSLQGGSPRETVRIGSEPPHFSWEYPPGLLREQIAPPLQMRALLPQVEVRTKRRLLKLYDGEQKTVLRIALEDNWAKTPGRSDEQPMPSLVTLKQVRGYDKHLKRVTRFLESKLALVLRQRPMIDLALESIGRQTLDYSSKLDFKLDSKQTTGEVMRQIHSVLLQTLETNLPGTRASIDSEFLHDFRVAVRRTRAALSQVKGVYPELVEEDFKTRFAWLGQLTGPTRDLDVYLLKLDQYRGSLPETYQPYLSPLYEFLEHHQKLEQQTMVRKLNSPHFHTLVKEWREFLNTPPDPQQDGPNAGKPIRKVASQRIYKMFSEVLETGRVIDAYTPPEALHDLRKSCKKLRYLLEFFQSLYPAKRIRPLIKSMKRLLENLGDFQDLEVQAEKLREFAHHMVQEAGAPADTLLAMGMLVDSLLKQQRQARDEFAERFAEFSSSEHLKAYERLFAAGSRASDKA